MGCLVASVTIAKRPSWWDGMAGVVDVIWGVRKQKYFCKRDSTGKSERRPTGKSVQSDGDAMKHCTVPRNYGDTATSEQTDLRPRLQMHRSRWRGQPHDGVLTYREAEGGDTTA
jgi:hypothetical protein